MSQAEQPLGLTLLRAGLRSGLALISVALLVSSPGAASAQGISLNHWGVETGTALNAIIRSGSTIYVGGNFKSIQPVVGGGAPVDPTTGAPRLGYPSVAGYVYSAVEDGAGGWFIGGEFEAVGGRPRRNLAHLLAHGEVSDWAPATDGVVQGLALRGRTLFVGGAFTTLGGVHRDNLGAVDAYTGITTELELGTDQGIFTLHLSGSTLYLGGYFSTVAGRPRNALAAIDITSGTLVDWNPSAGGVVYALADYADTLLVGGVFSTLGGAVRSYLGAVDKRTGTATSWDPGVIQTRLDRSFPGAVVGLAVTHDTLFVAGTYDQVDGVKRSGLAALSLCTRRVLDWDPQPAPWAGTGKSVFTFTTLYRGNLYVVGLFDSLGGRAAIGAPATAVIDTKSGVASRNWSLNPNDGVMVISAGESEIFFGGFFTALGGSLRRSGLAAFDAATGTPTPWHPELDGIVYSLALDKGRVLVGGDFFHVNDTAQEYLAAIDSVTGDVADWRPSCDAPVLAIVPTDSSIYVGGQFTFIGGATRPFLAALDRTTGEATSWNPAPDDMVNTIALDQAQVRVGGLFTTIGGAARRYAAAVDPASASATAWNPAPNSFVFGLAPSDSVVFLAGIFDHVGGSPRSGIACVDTLTGATTPFRADIFRDFSPGLVGHMVVNDGTLYVAGNFTQVGGLPLRAPVALNAHTGEVLTDWRANSNGSVGDIAWGGDRLLVSGSFQRIGLAAASLMAGISPVSRGQGGPVPPVRLSGPQTLRVTNPVVKACIVRYSLLRAASVRLAVYDLQGRAVGGTSARQMPAGEQIAELSLAGLRPGCYVVCVEADQSTSSSKIFVVR